MTAHSNVQPLNKIVLQKNAPNSAATLTTYSGIDVTISILATAIIAAAIYFIPDYLLLETIFRDISLNLLQSLGIEAWVTPPTAINVSGPALTIKGVYMPLYIARACTAMQAGALLFGLILVTKANLRNKIVAGITFGIILFIANILRLVFHFVLIAWGIPFWFAHDTLSKPIGFIGVIIFAMVMEKQGVPVITEMSNWIEYLWLKISGIFEGKKD